MNAGSAAHAAEAQPPADHAEATSMSEASHSSYVLGLPQAGPYRARICNAGFSARDALACLLHTSV